MRSRRRRCFWRPTTAATSRERNCSSMAASRKCRSPLKVRRSKKISPMENKKIYLLAELAILLGFLEEVKAILAEALPPTLQEPGCEALYETGREDDPHKLVFFEIFSSAEAHEFHLRQDYTNGCLQRWTGSCPECQQ